MSQQKQMLQALWEEVQPCRKCEISAFTTYKVFGDGYNDADIFLAGEAPGMDEDRCGHVFVGRAGGILSTSLHRAGISRPYTFIANVCKCHPPKFIDPQPRGNRTPTRFEMGNCVQFLYRQIEIVRPKVVVAMGGTAIAGIMGMQRPPVVKDWIGRSAVLKVGDFETTLIGTYHPQFLGYRENTNEGPKLIANYIDLFRRIAQWVQTT